MTWNWLGSTRALQREAFGHDWDRIRRDGDYLPRLRASIGENVTALTAELGEFLQELGPVWKSWATLPDELDVDARDRAVGELVDVVHFIANMVVALDVSDTEWEALYRAKQQRNRDRMAQPYDGVTGKCPSCKRDLTEAGYRDVVDDIGTIRHCGACDHLWPLDESVPVCERCGNPYASGSCRPATTHRVPGDGYGLVDTVPIRPYCATAGHYV